MTPIVICYYTKDTGYENEVENLVTSCERFSLPCKVDAIDSLGSWEQNCCYKPRYILEKLDELKQPVLWLDADSVVVQNPTLFDSLDSDIALRVVEKVPDDHPSKMISGTVFVNNTEKAREILKAWDLECKRMLQEEKEEVWDQIALRNVLLASDAKVTPLPRAYYMVYDKIESEEMKKEAIILHYQASRLFKKSINNLVVPFWEQSMIQQENREAFSESLKMD